MRSYQEHLGSLPNSGSFRQHLPIKVGWNGGHHSQVLAAGVSGEVSLGVSGVAVGGKMTRGGGPDDTDSTRSASTPRGHICPSPHTSGHITSGPASRAPCLPAIYSCYAFVHISRPIAIPRRLVTRFYHRPSTEET